MLALTSACGTTPTSSRPPNRVSPALVATPAVASASPTDVATPSPPIATTPAPTPSLPLAAVGFSCRLPIVTYRNQTTAPGFINFPSASFETDPAAILTSKAYGLAFDRAYGRWLPVDWRLVSDDGAHYVYVTYSSDQPGPGQYTSIHVVDVASGSDRVVSRSGQYVPYDYLGNGVYLTIWVGGHDGPGPQIGWVLDPSTGGIRALSGGQNYGYSIGSGAGWRTDYNPADPTVHQGMTGPNRLTRVDLASAAEATWFYQQGVESVQVLGFDRAGHPIVSSSVGQAVTVWLLADASHRSQLFTGSVYMNWAIADAHGIWFSDGGSTYLYTGASGLQRVASTGGEFAGGCH